MGIFGRIFGNNDPQFDNLLDRVNGLVDNIPNISLDSDNNSELVQKSINEFINSSDNASITGLFGNVAVPYERINRYTVYDELFQTVQLIKRIIAVYSNNILQKDLVSGKILILKSSDDISYTKYEKFAKKFIDDVFEKFGYIDLLKNKIIHTWLRYGDYFIEIIDLKNSSISIPKPNGVVDKKAENALKYLDSYIPKHNASLEDTTVIDNFVDIIFETEDQPEGQTNVGSENDELENLKTANLESVDLRFHKPHNVVIVKTFTDNIIGYLLVYEEDSVPISLSPTYRFAALINQLSGIDRSDVNDINKITDKLLKNIVQRIVNKFSVNFDPDPSKSPIENEKAYQSQLYKAMKGDVFFMLKKLISDIKTDHTISNKLKIRFVTIDKMIQISSPSSDYFPYGVSIIDPLVYPAKLYLLHQLANIVIKLSRAAVIRKWTVETGPRDIQSSLLNKLRREFKNQRTTVDDIMSFKTIPKILSDFKDMVLFSKKGQKFVDVDIQALGDPNAKVSDLEDARRELISLSGVPAAYLGAAEVTELRDQLVSVNINFAIEIANMQETICKKTEELVDKLYKTIKPNSSLQISKIQTVHLTPPVILMLQMLESTMTSISNISAQINSSLRGVPIDPTYLLKKYIPYIDWDDFVKAGRDFRVENKTDMAGQ